MNINKVKKKKKIQTKNGKVERVQYKASRP